MTRGIQGDKVTRWRQGDKETSVGLAGVWPRLSSGAYWAGITAREEVRLFCWADQRCRKQSPGETFLCKKKYIEGGSNQTYILVPKDPCLK